MSEDWQIPEGLVESLLTPDPCAETRHEAYSSGVDAGMAHIACMMMELIEELRSPFFSMDPELDPVLDRAEKRLKKVFNE